jgi:hypothetical protein
MSFRIRIGVAAVFALFLIMGLGGRSAIGGVAVAPLKQEISLKPGETGKVTLTLAYNNRLATDTTQKMKLELLDVLATDEGSLSFTNAGTLRNSACKWVAPDAGEVTLDPGESRTVDCRITVPDSAAPGEYYAVVMVTLATPGKTEKGVMVQYRIASGIFLTVLGRTFPKEARITRCEFIWPTSSGMAPAAASASQPADPGLEMPRVQVLLANTGQARFDGSGKLTVVNEQRRVVLVTPMTARRTCVFAGDSRLFEARIPKALASGKYTMRVEMDYQSEWAKARKDMPVEILPEQAALLAELRQRQRQEKTLVEASPGNLSVAVPAGAMRSLAITVKNVSDGDVACTAALAGDGVPGLTVLPDQFTITKGGKKTVVVRVETEDGAAGGPIAALLNVAASQDGGGHTELSIPVDVQRKMER